MSFRTDPLPSYEDIISGKFSFSKENNVPLFVLDSNDNKTTNKKDEISGEFKYKNVNKISEDFEEGEISEETPIIPKPVSMNNTQRNNNNNNPRKQQPPNNPSNAQNNKKAKITEKKSKTGVADYKSNLFPASNSTTRTPFVPRLICRYFMEGLCTKGDKCTFSHSSVPNRTPEEARVKEPCKFLIAGSCMKGDACYFSHDLSVVPCKFFHLKGECSSVSRGKACRFSHAPIDADALQKLKLSEEERIKEKQDTDCISNNTPSSYNSTTTNPEDLEAGKKTSHQAETSTKGPHSYDETNDEDMNLLNPFADGFGDDFA